MKTFYQFFESKIHEGYEDMSIEDKVLGYMHSLTYSALANAQSMLESLAAIRNDGQAMLRLSSLHNRNNVINKVVIAEKAIKEAQFELNVFLNKRR